MKHRKLHPTCYYCVDEKFHQSRYCVLVQRSNKVNNRSVHLSVLQKQIAFKRSTEFTKDLI